MRVALRPEWGLPQFVLSGLTAAVIASSSFGALHNSQITALPSVAESFSAAAQPSPAPAAAAAKPVLSANPPAPPFRLQARATAERQAAVRCLAEAIYFEAGFQPLEGQRAIAQVILNRVREKEFPDTVCGVVFEGAHRHTGCQFSFACDGSLHRRPPTEDELSSAETIARQALSGYVVRAVGTATHYHNDKVEPYWRDALVKTAQIGDHIFYRSPGKAGQPQALDVDRYAANNELKVAEAAPHMAHGSREA
jgi:spore germination cell wall hydrolase CwlJ-like protein